MVAAKAHLGDAGRLPVQPNLPEKKVPRRAAALDKNRLQTAAPVGRMDPVGLAPSSAHGSSSRQVQSAASVAGSKDKGAKNLRFSKPFSAGKFDRARSMQTLWEHMFGNRTTVAEAKIERTRILEEKAAKKKSAKEKKAANSAENMHKSLFGGSSIFFEKKTPPEDAAQHLDNFATKKLNDNCRSRHFSIEEFAHAQHLWCELGGESRIAEDSDWMDEITRFTGESKQSLSETPGYTAGFFKAHLQRPKTFDEFLDWYRAMAFCEFFWVPPARRRMRALGKKINISIDAVEHIRARFDEIDLNGSGQIDYSEFQHLMKNLFNAKDAYDLPERRLWSHWCSLDVNGDGEVTFDEYLLWYYKAIAINAYSHKRNADLAQQFYSSIRNLTPDKRIPSEVAKMDVDVSNIK